MVSPTTVSRRMWFPHPRLNGVFRKHDVRILYHVKSVDNVTGPDDKGEKAPIEADGSWSCSFDVITGVSMSDRMLDMYRGLAEGSALVERGIELAHESGKSAVAERWTAGFRLTSTGWRCPELSVRLNQQRQTLRQLDRLQDTLLNGL